MAGAVRHAGTVAGFDEHKGYGEVRGDDGQAWFFHCTAIADGSRSIEVGAAVSFTLVPGLRGVVEARDLRPA